MKQIVISFVLKMEEDFHVGTGMGKIGLYDDGQFKDEKGNPTLSSDTFKGLLRDSCRTLDLLRKELGISSSSYHALLFEDFTNLNSIDVDIKPALIPQNPTIIHYSTAIDETSRRAKSNSLHSVEYGSKGTEFRITLSYLDRSSQTAEIAALAAEPSATCPPHAGPSRPGECEAARCPTTRRCDR